ncbi:MAG: ArsC/Spx/MgsR family protein [Pseudomonadota bacterium]
MATLRLYHNPDCSKSRAALELLRASGVSFDVIEYLQQPPSRDALRALLRLLDNAPAELVRHDKHFNALGLDPDAYVDADAVTALLASHPQLMQRPIVATEGRALIARPPELLHELLD